MENTERKIIEVTAVLVRQMSEMENCRTGRKRK